MTLNVIAGRQSCVLAPLRYNPPAQYESRAMHRRVSQSVLLAAVLALPPALAHAHDYRVGSLVIDHPWAIATPQGATVGAGYMKITNAGAQPERLTGISSPVANKVAVHSSVQEGGVIKMRLLGNGLEIKPGETVELIPEGMHVMFEGLSSPLVAGTPAKATLVFEKAGNLPVEFTVVPLGTKSQAAPAQAHEHK